MMMAALATFNKYGGNDEALQAALDAARKSRREDGHPHCPHPVLGIPCPQHGDCSPRPRDLQDVADKCYNSKKSRAVRDNVKRAVDFLDQMTRALQEPELLE